MGMVNPASPMKETLKPVGTLNVSRGQNLELVGVRTRTVLLPPLSH